MCAGIGGLAPLLAEIGQYRALTAAERALAGAIAARLRTGLPARTEGSLYDGLTVPVVDRPDQWWAVPARRRGQRSAPLAAVVSRMLLTN